MQIALLGIRVWRNLSFKTLQGMKIWIFLSFETWPFLSNSPPHRGAEEKEQRSFSIENGKNWLFPPISSSPIEIEKIRSDKSLLEKRWLLTGFLNGTHLWFPLNSASGALSRFNQTRRGEKDGQNTHAERKDAAGVLVLRDIYHALTNLVRT